MATNESAAAGTDVLTLKGATGPAIGAVLAWLAIDLVVDPGGWPTGALIAAIGFLPLVGVALQRKASGVAVAAIGAVVGLSALGVVRGGTPSAPLLPVLALCGAFLIGFGYVLSDPNGSTAT